MNQIKYISILFIFFLGVMTSFAGNGGSTYSRFGLGDISYFSSDKAMGMGGTNISIFDQNSIDRMNPSSWVSINRTQFSVSALYEGFSTADNKHSAYLSSANFNGFMLAVPIASTSGIVFGAGITPFSRTNYNIITQVSQANFDYTLRYVGDGGLSQAHVGVSANLSSEFHLGAKFNYYFGTLRQTTTQTFTSSGYTNAERERSLRLKGIGFTYGAIYSGLAKIFDLHEKNELNIGAVFTTTSYLTSTEDRYFSYTTGTLISRDTISSISSGKVKMPYSFGAGISFLSERFLVASDIFFQNWSQYEARGFNSTELRDNYRLGIGGQLSPAKGAASFFQRLTYRLGYFYNASYYQINNTPINETGFTGGIDIPIFGETHFTLGTEYSFRGTTENNLQKDKILRISFTLSASELWFVRPEEE